MTLRPASRLLTHSRKPQVVVAAKRARANECLTKPFGAEALQDRLSGLRTPVRSARS